MTQFRIVVTLSYDYSHTSDRILDALEKFEQENLQSINSYIIKLEISQK